MTTYEKLRSRIVELVGEKECIDLECVLLAYLFGTGYRSNEDYKDDVYNIYIRWKLGKPLEQQDEETLLFIGKILEV